MRLATFRWIAMIGGFLAATTLCAAPEPAVFQLASTEHEPLVDHVFPILKEAYSRIGIDVNLVLLPGERSVQMLNAGKVDGDVIHSAGIEKFYPNLLQVSVPLAKVEAVAFTYRRTILVDGWDSLQNYRVCIRHGIKVIEMAAARMHKLEVVDDYRIAFDMLKAGHCDVAVLPRQAWFEAQRLQVTGLRAMEPPLQSWPMYHYVGKAHADIVPALSNVLTQMQKSGLFDSEDAAFQRSMDEVRRVQETK